MTKEQIITDVLKKQNIVKYIPYFKAAMRDAMEEWESQQLSAERERYDELKSKYDALVMDNMTHEYNAAEAQRHLPDLIKQYVDCERERAWKLVEALDTIISQNQCCMEDYVISQIIKIAKQTLNEYDPKK